MRNTSLEVLQGRIGYHFKDLYLLECALTHTSFANEQKIHRYKDYERLEFLGDAVLEMVSSAFLYNEYPDKREGELTKIRASLVCEPSLADCARHLGLPALLRLGKGEEASGGREKESILCDVVEAVIGAMYLDCGKIEPPRQFIMKYILSDRDRTFFYDSKSMLQEWAQGFGGTLRYEILGESGPEHCKTYKTGVFLGNKLLGTGEGRSKKAAEQQAAYAGIKKVREGKA
jgi:ribonuclease-3